MDDTTSALPVPGWYPDPGAAGQVRWWDGTGWTAHIAPIGTGGPMPPPSMPGATPQGQATTRRAAREAAAARSAPVTGPESTPLPDQPRVPEPLVPEPLVPTVSASSAQRMVPMELARTISADRSAAAGPAVPSFRSIPPIPPLQLGGKASLADHPWFAQQTSSRPAGNRVGWASVVLALLGSVAFGTGIGLSLAAVPHALAPLLLLGGAMVLLVALVLGVVGLTRRGRSKVGASIGLALAVIAGAIGPIAFPGAFRPLLLSLQDFPDTTMRYLATGNLCSDELPDAAAAGVDRGATGGGFPAGFTPAPAVGTIGSLADIPAEFAELRDSAVCVVRIVTNLSNGDGILIDIEAVAVLSADVIEADAIGPDLVAQGYSVSESPGSESVTWVKGVPADLVSGAAIPMVQLSEGNDVDDPNATTPLAQSLILFMTLTLEPPTT